MSAARATAHPPTNATTLLQALLASPTYPTILLICSRQSDFVRETLSSIGEETATATHALLRPTLYALSVSPHVSIVFTPTVSHLRAWLTVADQSAFAPAAPSAACGKLRSGSNRGEKAGIDRHRRLVVWNLVSSSSHTSEWSVQGLCETLAVLVDCSHRLNCAIHLAEASEPPAEILEHGGAREDDTMQGVRTEGAEGAEMSQADDETATTGGFSRAQIDVFHRQLPMLNGSSRRTGLDESAAWSGRTVEVGIVLGRWFVFSSAEI